MKINRLDFSLLQTFLYGLISFHFVKFVNGYCERTEPIKSNGSCSLRYCTEEEFANKTCIIDNEIIKTQYLNNKIFLDESNQNVYLDIVRVYDGEILIEFTNQTTFGNRKFFGLRKNGSYTYGNPINMSAESFIFINNANNIVTEDINLIWIEDEINYEYLISLISNKNESYFENYDFFNKNKNEYSFQNIFSLMTINGSITKFEIKENYTTEYNKSFLILGGIVFQKFKLFKINITNEINQINLVGDITTENIELDYNFQDPCCFTIDDKKIICFLYSNNTLIRNVFNYQLQKEKTEILSIPNLRIDLLKCIHIKYNTGSFIYSTNENFIHYINIEFIKYTIWENFTNYLPTIKYPTEFNYYSFRTNNFIKMSENKICFITTTLELSLKIYLIYLYEQEEDELKKVILREYNLETFNLYHFYIDNKLSSVIYNNFIALAFNYKTNDSYSIYAGLLIFGYANSTDYTLDLENHIVNENNLHIEIDLKSFLKIENNIFGYEYSYSKIMDLINCNDIIFYSSKDKNKNIIIDSILENNETIQFDFEIKEYNAFECLIKYINVVSEPNLTTFNNYPNNYTNLENDTYFDDQKGEYIGKQSTYKIMLNYEIKKSCSEGCFLCLNSSQFKCLISNNSMGA